MSPETDYSRYYRVAAARYDELRLDRDDELELTSAIVRSVVTSPGLVVDLGCGTGRYAPYLSVHGLRVVGVDASIDQLVNANDLDASICASISALPLKARMADCALASLVIHQLDAPLRQRCFDEVCRVLKPSGAFVIKTCSHEDLKTRWVEDYFPSAHSLNRRRYPPIDYLCAELRRSRFDIESVVPTQTVPEYDTQQLLKSIAGRHNTTLGLVSDGEIAEGLRRLRADLAGKQFVAVPQAHTLVIGRGPS